MLAERVTRGDWDRLLPGEAVVLDGRRSYFRAPEVDHALAARCAEFDVHPSGPMWGRGASPADGEAASIEAAVLAREPGLCTLLECQGLEHERRPLRLPVRALQWSLEDSVLALEFELPRGSFATAVLHEVVRGAWDGPDGSDG